MRPYVPCMRMWYPVTRRVTRQLGAAQQVTRINGKDTPCHARGDPQNH